MARFLDLGVISLEFKLQFFSKEETEAFLSSPEESLEQVKDFVREHLASSGLKEQVDVELYDHDHNLLKTWVQQF